MARGLALAIAASACGSHADEAAHAEAGRHAVAPPTAAPEAPSSARAEISVETRGEASACPADMLLVDTSYCPDVRRECLHDEYSSSNKITICHAFAHAAPKCRAPERRMRFCIDRFEYPNQAGARAPVMVDFYDAMALCSARGKRLCWEGEWNAACEGPDETPFPYGYERDPAACNIDNLWIRPSLDKIYSTDPAVSGAELLRLDQGVPSGARPRCTSGFGVHDLTGNVDEWVMLETKRGKGGWAGLKGGAWGHVRNACRPVTTSHAAEFTYYFISLRCCADAKPVAEGGGAPPWIPPPLPVQKKAAERLFQGFTPTAP
ncbi:MAG TPA: SUMF1/EgtB/PvdO family nonheme iron enzyme [Polyangiaceae bacterium]|nr:SUMF1/EgtB/PvdO family nonheme iron enzyme [Polyangiaceae bacterium]